MLSMIVRACAWMVVGVAGMACAGCGPAPKDLSNFTLFEYGQRALADNLRYPEVLWARIGKVAEGQYHLQIALIGTTSTAEVVLPERDLTAEEVQRMLSLFSSLEFTSDLSSLLGSGGIIAPAYRWDDFYSEPGDTFSAITTDSQTDVVTFLRDLAKAS
jgi:hypothetical protein